MIVLETERLRLREPAANDAARIYQLAGRREVALGTLNIPHPYPEEAAAAFITNVRELMAGGHAYVFAIVPHDVGQLVGTVGLSPDPFHAHAEIGYWIGLPYWNRGYMTEAVRRVLTFGFAELKLKRIFAHCFTWNVGSTRVLQKAGMTHEGTLRQHFMRFDEPQDTAVYGILREEWLTQHD